jgi:hypothetical protein
MFLDGILRNVEAGGNFFVAIAGALELPDFRFTGVRP